ncbi:MAG: histidine kinase [Ardenticatenaceae bacterium]|nr:histidine kinase [Ardenticatenaceae bacterium]HBY97273.1 hypothetical protein [Chloroflexota bacterium]
MSQRHHALSLRSLRVQILLWTILPLTILLIAFSLTGIRSHQRSMRAVTAEHNSGIVLALASAISASLDRYTVSIEVLAGSERLHRGDEGAVQAALTDAGQILGIASLLAVDPSGEIVAAVPPRPDWTAEAIRSMQALPAGTHEPLVSATSDGRTVFWAVPVPGRALWLLGDLPLDELALGRMLSIGHLGTTASAVLVDRAGRALFTTGPLPASADWQRWPGVSQALAGENGVLFVNGAGTENVVAYAPIPRAGWALVIREPWESLTAPLLRFNWAVPFVLVAAAVASLLTLFFGLRYVVRPLHLLGLRADRIGAGDFDAAAEPVGGVTEIEDLRRTLDRMARQIQHDQRALQEYLGAVTRAQEEERVRLARELHDETVQTLIALSQRAQMAQRTLARDPARATERLGELRAMLGEAIEEVRRFSRALRPHYLEELGLAPSLEMLAREAGARFHLTGAPRRLSPDQELALYRIAQEALNNAHRHAQAQEVEVKVTFTEIAAVLQIADNGVGFEVPGRPADLTRAGHFGLMGMRERTQAIGGELTVSSMPGRGTVVTVAVDGSRGGTPDQSKSGEEDLDSC